VAAEEYVQSLARGLEVLRAFDAEHPRQTLSEVAGGVGLTRATARRFLLTLVELGYLHSDGKLFSLTPRVLELGHGYLSGLGLAEVVQPHLERLSAQVGESTSASVLDGNDIVYVARVPVQRIMTVTVGIGTRFPASATSMGRAMLAALPSVQLPDELPTFTSRTISDRSALIAELDRVRERGWAMVDGELEDGVRSLAVAVREADGSVAGAINVAGRSDGDPGAFESRVRDAVVTTGAAIERDLAALRR